MLTAELDAHAQDLRWTPDGQALCFLVAEHGRIDLRRVALDGGKLRPWSRPSAKSWLLTSPRMVNKQRLWQARTGHPGNSTLPVSMAQASSA